MTYENLPDAVLAEDTDGALLGSITGKSRALVQVNVSLVYCEADSSQPRC
jgi:hypothetical protein